MNCDEFRAAILAGEANERTAGHAEACPACRSHVDELKELHLVLAEPALWDEPSPELGSRVESLIGAAATGGAAGTFAGSKRRRLWAAAVAAAVILIVSSAVAMRGDDPDWEVALPATELAPNASASVSGWNEAAGTRMVVHIEGLDPAPAGYMYEFWLSDGPLHISAGTFRSGGNVELWSGVARASFPRLWVTLEPIDEDESPSPATVLDTGPGSA